MLQGLAIRRFFAVLDAMLVLLALGAGCLVVMGVFSGAPAFYAGPVAEAATEDETPSMLADVLERREYDRILKSRLFGPAGDKQEEALPKPVETSNEPMEETKLNLSLRGTVAIRPTDPLASATIENKDTREVRVYGLGHTIVEGVTLKEVYPREVVIANRGKDEVLRMDEDKGKESPLLAKNTAPAPRGDTGIVKQTAPDRFDLDKNEFVRQLYVNYPELIEKVQPRLYYDESGKVAGLTASNIQDIPLAQTLDLKDGDVLQSINGEPIDSEEAIIRIINKNRDMSTFRIGILRDGQQITRTYQMN